MMFWPSTATCLENLKRKIISILGCQSQEGMTDERKGPLCPDKDRRGEKCKVFSTYDNLEYQQMGYVAAETGIKPNVHFQS